MRGLSAVTEPSNGEAVIDITRETWRWAVLAVGVEREGRVDRGDGDDQAPHRVGQLAGPEGQKGSHRVRGVDYHRLLQCGLASLTGAQEQLQPDHHGAHPEHPRYVQRRRIRFAINAQPTE